MSANTVSPIKSKLLYGTKPIANADGEEFVLVKIRLLNSRDEAVPDVAAELFADREGVTIVQPGKTDHAGLAAGYVRATTPGPVTIRARIVTDENELTASSESSQSSESLP